MNPVVATDPPLQAMPEDEGVPLIQRMMERSVEVRNELLKRTHSLAMEAIEDYLLSDLEGDLLYQKARKEKARFALTLIDSAIMKLPSFNINESKVTHKRELPPPRVITKQEMIEVTRIALLTEQEDKERRNAAPADGG